MAGKKICDTKHIERANILKKSISFSRTTWGILCWNAHHGAYPKFLWRRDASNTAHTWMEKH